MNKLEAITINPSSKINSVIIWLHGLGADGHDFEPIVPELNFLTTRFIFPHAPIRPITLNANFPMRAWYNVSALNMDPQEDETGIRFSQLQIEQLINEQIELGISASNIFLVGFSQGGAMALHTGLRFNQSLGGIAALSAYLPLPFLLTNEIHGAQKSTPIFMAHGTFDTVLPVALGQASKAMLEKLNLKVEWHSYSIDHSVCPEEIVDLKAFLKNLIQ